VERGAHLVRTSKERFLLVRLHRRLALAEWDRGHFDPARAHLEAGLQALAGSEPSAELAELLHVQVILLKRHGDFNGVSTAAQNLATLAELLGSRRTNRGQVYPFSTYVGWLRDVGYEADERNDLSPTPPISLITARRPTAEEEEE
jgi:hypothetical protein